MNLAVQIVQIVASLTILIGIIGLYIQYKQNKKLNFLKCTERYIEIQKLFISNQDLAKLNLDVLGKNKKKTGINEEGEEESFSKEIALCSIMFQLMEDVWTMHELDRNLYNKHYSGWNNLFSDWMSSKRVRIYWEILQHHYNTSFIAFVDGLYNKK